MHPGELCRVQLETLARKMRSLHGRRGFEISLDALVGFFEAFDLRLQ